MLAVLLLEFLVGFGGQGGHGRFFLLLFLLHFGFCLFLPDSGG